MGRSYEALKPGDETNRKEASKTDTRSTTRETLENKQNRTLIARNEGLKLDSLSQKMRMKSNAILKLDRELEGLKATIEKSDVADMTEFEEKMKELEQLFQDLEAIEQEYSKKITDLSENSNERIRNVVIEHISSELNKKPGSSDRPSTEKIHNKWRQYSESFGEELEAEPILSDEETYKRLAEIETKLKELKTKEDDEEIDTLTSEKDELVEQMGDAYNPTEVKKIISQQEREAKIASLKNKIDTRYSRPRLEVWTEKHERLVDDAVKIKTEILELSTASIANSKLSVPERIKRIADLKKELDAMIRTVPTNNNRREDISQLIELTFQAQQKEKRQQADLLKKQIPQKNQTIPDEFNPLMAGKSEGLSKTPLSKRETGSRGIFEGRGGMSNLERIPGNTPGLKNQREGFSQRTETSEEKPKELEQATEIWKELTEMLPELQKIRYGFLNLRKVRFTGMPESSSDALNADNLLNGLAIESPGPDDMDKLVAKLKKSPYPSDHQHADMLEKFSEGVVELEKLIAALHPTRYAKQTTGEKIGVFK